MKYIILALIILFLSIFCLFMPFPQSAQTNLKGTWKSDEYDQNKKHKIDDENETRIVNKDGIWLSFRYQTKNGSSMNSSTYSLAELSGLTKEQTEGNNTRVSFQIVREAGMIACEGTFNKGKGEGTWQFTPDRNFAEAMEKRGFTFSDEKILTAAMLDLTVALADDIKSAGFKDIDIDDLFKAKIFKIDSKFMKEMAATGFPNLNMEDLVKSRIFKIDAGFVKEVTEMGFAKDSLEDLVKLRIFKIDAPYLREMKAIGFDKLTAEEATKLRIFKVTPEFVKEMKDAGLPNLSVEEVVRLRIFKIDGEYVRRARSKQTNSLDVEDLVRQKIHGKH